MNYPIKSFDSDNGTEFNYVVFQCSLNNGSIETGMEQLYQKQKEANKNYLEKLSRLNAD